MILRSPVTGRPLAPDTAHSLADDAGGRWPVIDAIPYLRVGRDDLVGEALGRLDRGDAAGALVELLRDADDWWDERPPERGALHELLAARDRVTLREAMAALGFGRVGDYFAHRWSDPTFLAAPWPIGDAAFDLVLCQDAFYFLEPKPAILARLRAAVADGGALLVGPIHNGEAPNHSAGAGVTAGALARLFPDAAAYDDAELTRSAAEGRAPVARAPAALRHAEAFAVAEGAPARAPVDLAAASRGAPCRNPLYAGEDGRWVVRWPSERYRAEYAALATYPPEDASSGPTPDGLRRRVFLDLPERW